MNVSYAQLPIVLTDTIFSYLETKDICSCSDVNKTWKQVANAKCAGIIKSLNFKYLNISNYVRFFYCLKPQVLNSDVEILERIQTFVNKIPLGINARLRCSFDFSNRLISVEIKGSEDPIPQPIHLSSGYGTVFENSVNKYNYEEYFFSLNIINDSYFKKTINSRYIGRFHYVIQLDSSFERTIVCRPKKNACIQAILRFPKFFASPTELEKRITYLVLQKCEQLSMQFMKQEVPLIYTPEMAELTLEYFG